MAIRVGDQLEFDGETYIVCALSADRIALRGLDGGPTREIAVEDFVRLPGMRSMDSKRPRSEAADIVAVQYLSEAARQEVQYFASHLRQLLASIEERAYFSTSTRELIVAKQKELAAAGTVVSVRTLERKIKTFRERGVAGLVDHRKDQESATHRRVDPRVVGVLAEVMSDQAKASSGTRLRLRELTVQLLEQRFGAGTVPVPSKSTFFRLIADLDRGRMTTGSAKTRRSLANRPERAFASMGVSRPGEQVQIDSTSLDVLIQLDGGLVDRPDLTIMLDVATRTIVSGVLRPGSTKSVDLVVALARALVPHNLRPGDRAETRALVQGAFESKPLVNDEDLEAYRRRQPYIFPETITTDRGKIYISEHFENACEQLGISLNVSAGSAQTLVDTGGGWFSRPRVRLSRLSQTRPG